MTFFIVMFVLLMLFLFKYIDDLIGKGFEWYVILQLLVYAAATNVAMALPLAVLLSSIMTFGNLGENYELVAIKSAGISLQKAMAPLFIMITGLSVGAFIFSDYMLPVANLKMGSLLYDVRNQKAAFLIEEGVFNNSIPGYSIRVEKKEKDGETLKDVVIYDHTKGSGNTNVLMADTGLMYKTEDNNYMVLILKSGVRYEESAGNTYNPRERLVRYKFSETQQKFDLSSFNFKRENESLFKNNYQMMNLKELDSAKVETSLHYDSVTNMLYRQISPYYKLISPSFKMNKDVEPAKLNFEKDGMFAGVSQDRREMVAENASQNARSVKDYLESRSLEADDLFKTITRYIIEYNRKFTLSVSCLVLFFIGAPLGAIIRKGGLGLPVVVSVIFFLFYHIVSTIGEKMARDGTLSPIMGMWIAIFILTPLGLFLTYKATADSVLFDVDYYKNVLKKIFKKKERK